MKRSRFTEEKVIEILRLHAAGAKAAELLEVPLGTLKSQVARAKAKCREMWSAGDHG